MRARFVAQRLSGIRHRATRESVAALEAVTETEPVPETPTDPVQRPEPNPPYIPWAPTDQLKKKKHYFKRMAFLVETLEKEQEAVARAKKQIPDFNPGDVLRLRLRVGENMNKEAEFTGVCIAIRNKAYRSSFVLRKTWPPSLGIERTFPLYCPTILEIKVVGRKDVGKKRKLYHLRDTPKSTAV